jgi:hypothetical protein
MLHETVDTFCNYWPDHSYLWISSRPATIMKVGCAKTPCPRGPAGDRVVRQMRREEKYLDENRFWAMIEAAWNTVGGEVEPRQRLVEGRPSENRLCELGESLDTVIAALNDQLSRLGTDELLAFDRILERKLCDIDRADIHERTGGSEDGFLYCRGFIVAIGRGYYEAVQSNPAMAVADAECREICYLSWNLYWEQFGEVPPSEISRESCSNSAGWPADVEELVCRGRGFVMGVRQAIRKAEALLPGERVEEGTDPRWQAIMSVGDYIESEPEAVWQFIRRWGGHPQEDLRLAVACVLLEHLLEYHFAAYYPQVEQLAITEPLFGDMFLVCWCLGQAKEPGNVERFQTLREWLQQRRPTE